MPCVEWADVPFSLVPCCQFALCTFNTSSSSVYQSLCSEWVQLRVSFDMILDYQVITACLGQVAKTSSQSGYRKDVVDRDDDHAICHFRVQLYYDSVCLFWCTASTNCVVKLLKANKL